VWCCVFGGCGVLWWVLGVWFWCCVLLGVKNFCFGCL
jgi:hypothetical protein